MSNFTISWKLEIYGEAGRNWKFLGGNELRTIPRAGKICKILHKLEIYTSQIYA